MSSGSLDYAGVLVLLLEVVTSAPQFAVLTMWVVARAFISSPLMPSTNPVFSQDRRDAAVHRLGSFKLRDRMDRSCGRCSSGTRRATSHRARVVESGQVINGTVITGSTIGTSRKRSRARLW